MKIETLSVFPGMFTEVMSTSILGRAQNAGLLEFVAHDLRKWTHDNHNTTDDEPYGGGAGQLMKVEPIFEALDELLDVHPAARPSAPGGELSEGGALPQVRGEPGSTARSPYVIFFTPVGKVFTQEIAAELASEQHLIMVCGRYEGFDERVYSRADLQLSLGDYVLTGGELAAMVVADAVCRLLPGVLGDERSAKDESFSTGLLEYPQYTRPAIYRDMEVPQVLLSGHHRMIDEWRRKQAIIRTAQLRPDLLALAALSAAELVLAKAYLQSNGSAGDSSKAEAEQAKAHLQDSAAAGR